MIYDNVVGLQQEQHLGKRRSCRTLRRHPQLASRGLSLDVGPHLSDIPFHPKTDFVEAAIVPVAEDLHLPVSSNFPEAGGFCHHSRVELAVKQKHAGGA